MRRTIWTFCLTIQLVIGAQFAFADYKQVKELYEAILRPGAQLPAPEQLSSDIADTIRELPASELKVLLPLGKQALESTNADVKRAGLVMMMIVGLRRDSATAIDPYVDDLAKMLDEPAVYLRQPAIYTLSTLKPKPSSRAMGVLRSHLDDKLNTGDQVVMIAAALMQSSPENEKTTETVLQVVQSRGDVNLRKRMLDLFGYYKVNNTGGSSFIRTALSDRDPAVRAAAVEASGKYGNGISNPFYLELARIAADKEENSQTRAKAESVTHGAPISK